jgi:hypothetical protein
MSKDIGLCGSIITGFDDSERVARSFSGTAAGNFGGGAGRGVAERGVGVPERNLSNLCVLVSTRRTEGG